MLPKALVTIQIPEDELSILRTRFDVVQAGWGVSGKRLTENELIKKLVDIQVLFVGYEPVTFNVIQNAPYLKFIGCSRGNPINVNVSSATAHGIPVAFTPGRNAIAAAEFTMGLIIAISRKIAAGHHLLKTGHYLSEQKYQNNSKIDLGDVTWDLDGNTPYRSLRGFELAGKTLGLIGFGSVGSRVAKLAKAFDMKVIAATHQKDKENARKLKIKRVDLDTILKISDIVSIHCRVTPETINLINENRLSLMKPTAILINTARACMVDEQALIAALVNHKIGGAALDVFWQEPIPFDHPLLALENVLLTPHLGGSTFEVPGRQSRMLINDLFLWMDGKLPLNLINPEVITPRK